MRRPICLYLLLIVSINYNICQAGDARLDFRILLDASVGMQRQDPENLRNSALQLLTELIPAGAQSGAWTYGRYVDMILPWKKVDENWRRQAREEFLKLQASAQRSHIEKALQRAKVGWNKPDAGYRRVLLLLSAAPVSVADDTAQNDRSRGRILDKLLPEIKAAGAEVHGVALGPGSDETLLKRLAVATGGSFSRAMEAGELKNILFNIYRRISNPEMLALRDRQFLVDKGIRELTLVLFDDKSGESTLLIPPDSPALSAQKPRVSKWRSGEDFDLVRIKNPEAGLWRVSGNPGAASRILIDAGSGLQLKNLLPAAYATPADRLEINAELFLKGKKIRKNSFLRFVEFELEHIDVDGNPHRQALEHSSEREHKGRYLLNIEDGLTEGRHFFRVSAETRTFNRFREFDVEVRWPLEVRLQASDVPGVYDLQLKAREEYIKPEGLVAEVVIEAPDGASENLELQQRLGGWLQGRIETGQDGLYQAWIKLSAQTHEQRIIDLDIGRISMLGVTREPAASPADTAEAAPVDPGMDRRQIGYIVLGANLALVLLAFLGWLILRRKAPQDDFEIDSEDLGIEPQE